MAPRESGPEAKQEQAQGLKMCCAPIVGRSRSVKSTCLRRRLPVSDPRRRPESGCRPQPDFPPARRRF